MMCQRVLTRRLALIGLGTGWALGVMGIAAPARAEDIFLASPMVTDATDKQLINPWGISASGTSPFWISDNGAGVSTLYAVDPNSNVATKLPLVVTIPDAGSVTGQAFNGGSGFNGDRFLFVSEDGIHIGLAGRAWYHRREAPVDPPRQYLQGHYPGYHRWAQLPAFGKLQDWQH